MKVFTVQPLEVLDIIEKKGYFTCEKAKSENYKDFYSAYNWLAKEMIRRKIYPVESNTLPVWCWYLYDGKNKLDLRHSGLGTPKEKQVCLELEIQENKILLSDYGAWHFVLNNSWYDDSTSEREFDKLHAWFDTLPYKKQEELKVKSWQKIFDITQVRNEWSSNGYYVQGTFWAITKDMIVNTKEFIAR